MSCDACIKAEITCKPILKEPGEHAKKLGEKVYSDIWGMSRHQTIKKKSYYVSFTDDYLRESVIYLIGSKDQVFSRYKQYEAMMLQQQDICIQTLVSDHGGKYTSKEFRDYLALKCTRHKLMIHNTLEQNRIAE